MHRLLQGDVGSGKTVVSALALAKAAENGYQACIMVPTEILAQQHYETLQAFLEPAGISCGLLTSSVKGVAPPRTFGKPCSRQFAGACRHACFNTG